MRETVTAIVLSLFASFIYDSIKTAIKRKPTSQDSHEYTQKYFHDVKLEFYISFPLGILFALSSVWHPEEKQLLFTLAFFMFFISLMAFMCLVEIVNNLTNQHSNDDVR